MRHKRTLGYIVLFCTLTVLVGASATGCSGGYHHAPVDAAQARETLQLALDSWKNGDPVDSLQSASPPIYVIDAEWQSGARLTQYQLLGTGEEKDAHLFCPVRLVLRDGAGQEIKREVTYIISTAPNRTVSRKLF